MFLLSKRYRLFFKKMWILLKKTVNYYIYFFDNNSVIMIVIIFYILFIWNENIEKIKKNSYIDYEWTLKYHFSKWEDYETYLWNYHDNWNDFNYTEKIDFIPDTETEITEFDKALKFTKMMEAFDEDEDVNTVSSNEIISPELQKEVDEFIEKNTFRT